jgi:hypothetical protein
MDPGWGLVVAAAGDTVSTPRGPTIDVFNFVGGRYRTYHQHHQEAHRRLPSKKFNITEWAAKELAPPVGL